MKKLIVIFLTVFLLSPSFMYAQENSPKTAEEMSVQKEDYQLPYAGILPGNPLYSLKIARDKIVSFLISDSLRKAEFNVLQADKRLDAGRQLFERGNEELSEETISKGENYFEDAIGKIEEAKREGKDVKPLQEIMSQSIKKHIEVVNQLEKKARKKKKQFAQIHQRLIGFEKRLIH